MYRSEVSLVQLGNTRIDWPATKERVYNYVNRGCSLFIFFSAVGFLSVSNVLRCARSVESVMRRARACICPSRACISSIVVRALTVFTLLCVVPVRQTAPRELPSLQEQAVRAERQWQPQRTVQQLQCVQCKCYMYDFSSAEKYKDLSHE